MSKDFRKERLSCNVTKETLFVGLGGIGSDIIKRVAARCTGTEMDNLRFVVMDTNANDLKNIKNAKKNVTYIQTSSTQSVLDYLNNDSDASNNWFPVNTTLYSKTVSEGAGQVRAISRLALNATIKNGEIQKLYKAIDELFLKDGGDLKQALRVVIVGSACGGTGSGIAMTVGMLIRQYLHKNYREKAAIIRGYLLLPGVLDTVISTESEKESLRRNGYATIKEINSFMIKASGFCGVRKELERYKDLHIDVPTTTGGVERLEGLPFDFCFLLDRVDQSQESMQTMDQYKDFAARSLYEQNIGPMEAGAFGMEDNIIKEFANGDNLGRNRFGGIGASTLRYPYEDIIEYVANSRAISCIGEGASVGNWVKYDVAYKLKKAEIKKRRALSMEEIPPISDFYIDQVSSGETIFDVDIRNILGASSKEAAKAEIETRVKNFCENNFMEYVKDYVGNDVAIAPLMATVTQMTKNISYEAGELRGESPSKLKSLRTFEKMIRSKIVPMARSIAESITVKSPAINGKVEDYHIEKLLKNNDGAIHPNAMRYVLYFLNNVIEEKLTDLKKEVEGADGLESTVLSFSKPDAKRFDVVGGKVGKKATETTFEQLCELNSPNNTEANKEVWAKLNKEFSAYARALEEYSGAKIEITAYEVAKEYVKGLCDELEAFFGSFENKVSLIDKAQEEIVDRLKFKEGDSLAYVCATKQHLDCIAERCPSAEGDSLLPADLNAEVFEGIKENVERKRIAVLDPFNATESIDVFETTIMEYFRKSVREDCDEQLNINIVRAIQQEQLFTEYLKKREIAEENEIVPIPVISDASKMDYLREKVMFGKRLASAGVGYANFNEPRTVNLCAYNAKLDDMRDVSVSAIVQPFSIGATATNTVSKYDISFFNALYNITPDVLSRFKSPEKCCIDGEYDEDAGIYFKAYHDYIQKLGPDSTKSGAISLHVDKRWDSLTEMPELSMKAHYNEMVKIHSALIYGIVYGMIKKHTPSKHDKTKRVFALEDAQGERTALVVSNNTECDEFYEVLDALYRDRASVANIYEMVAEQCRSDIDRNARYDESGFVKESRKFKIGDGHAPVTSLFEIPLMYFNSLPRAKMDDNELSIMIDSVINVLETEIHKYEQEVDRKPYLAEKLIEQFKTLVKNFNNDAYNLEGAMRKNTKIYENAVMIMVCKKVCNKIKALNISEFAQKTDELRAMVKEPDEPETLEETKIHTDGVN